MSEVAEERLFDNLAPEAVIEQAETQWGPFKARVCLFSGGNDSLATAHRCADHFDRLVFVDTGTAVPGVRDHVETCAEWLGKPLSIYEAAEGEYERIVLGGIDARGVHKQPLGFPGPMAHGRCYTNLKERALERMKADLKDGDSKARILALTGIRRAESSRRAKREHVTKRGAMIFANPLIDWTGADLHRYRRQHSFPESDVAALLHRSGECNCGAYAAPGEREMLRDLWPEWFENTIGRLERKAEAAGLECAKWGTGRELLANRAAAPAGDLCTDCQLRFDEA